MLISETCLLYAALYRYDSFLLLSTYSCSYILSVVQHSVLEVDHSIFLHSPWDGHLVIPSILLLQKKHTSQCFDFFILKLGNYNRSYLIRIVQR
jgi:hypothetical protein